MSNFLESQKIQQNSSAFTFERVICDFCGSDRSEPIPAPVPAVRCLGPGCGVIYLKERLSAESLREYYSRTYFESSTSSDHGYDNYLADRPSIRKTFQKRLKLIESFYSQKGSILDVGCAMAFFVEVAQQNGWTSRGIDISEFCVNYAQALRLNVQLSTLEQFEASNESVDVITMWDYIEHSTHPRRDLEKAYRLIKKGGLLVLATPDITSLPAKIFNKNWMGFKEHEHLYYFSGEFLKRKLQSMGFQVLKSQYAGKYISPEFFARRLGLYFPRISKWLRFLIRKKWIPDWSFYCNPRDIVLIIARKA